MASTPTGSETRRSRCNLVQVWPKHTAGLSSQAFTRTKLELCRTSAVTSQHKSITLETLLLLCTQYHHATPSVCSTQLVLHQHTHCISCMCFPLKKKLNINWIEHIDLYCSLIKAETDLSIITKGNVLFRNPQQNNSL